MIEQSDWLTQGLTLPNGLQRQGNTLYVSHAPPGGGEILTVEILDDGRAGTPQPLAALPGLPDDFSVAGGYLLTTGYSAGQIHLFSIDGRLIRSSPRGSHASPSQVRVGRPPLFDEQDLLVTEKGLLGEGRSENGNALTLLRPLSR